MQESKPITESKDSTLSLENACPARLLDRLAPKILQDVRATFKAAGVKGILRRYGWKIVAGFFAYYLIRDSILYLVIPYLITKGLLF